MNPLISIIIPIYKVEKYLRSCVDSVLSQSYKNIEVILVDDGSPDACPQICDEYKSIDKRIVVIHKKNGGLSDARNEGLSKATGDYVLFLDSDDLWTEECAVSRLVEVLSANPDSDLVFFQKYSFIDGTTPVTPSEYSHLDCKLNGASKLELLQSLQKRANYLTSAYTKLIRKNLLTDYSIQFEKGLLSEDYDWSIELYSRASKIVFSDEIFYGYRVRSGSITKTVGIKHLKDLLWVIEKWNLKLASLPIEQEEKDIYYDFLCYVLTILIANINILDREHRLLLNSVSKYKCLFSYARNPKTSKISKVISCLGLYPTSLILHVFLKIR